ncbi:unnamed protein product [Clonostachys chloroleuca]|uniref:Enoyl reductase (ER) domain-containing protein n=1 Tax=Clonostachys chloroleuca TaxID=1926264 RepID=A0AA35M9Q9_9HYPO|nr:unnamed protein product [Clonostachys chloroleuca]
MSAWVIAKTGGDPDSPSLELRESCPTPSKATEANVIIKIEFAALNQVDFHFMRSHKNNPFRRTSVPGFDFSGRIVAKGPFAPLDLDLGDEVCGVISNGLALMGKGTLAEYIEVPASLVVPRPLTLNMAATAGLGLATQAALTMLQSRPVKAGHKVVINGAGGGVGSALTQIVKSEKGAYVVGICSADNMDRLGELGADHVCALIKIFILIISPEADKIQQVLDFESAESIPDLLSSTYGEDIDTVFDCVGDSSLYKNSASFLKRSGVYVGIPGDGSKLFYGPSLKRNALPEFLGGGPRHYKAVHLSPSGDLQREAVRLADQGIITEVPIDSMFCMDQAVEAYERVMSSKTCGKVIIRV